MKPLKFSMTMALVFSLLSACSQVKYGIQKSYVYRTVSAPGNINIDDGGDDGLGKRMIINYVVFIETKGSAAVWKKAIIGHKDYSISLTPIKEVPFRAGMLKDSETPVIINIRPGNTLWQMELAPLSSTTASPHLGSTGVVLSGSYNRKSVSYKINKIVDLKSPEYY